MTGNMHRGMELLDPECKKSWKLIWKRRGPGKAHEILKATGSLQEEITVYSGVRSWSIEALQIGKVGKCEDDYASIIFQVFFLTKTAHGSKFNLGEIQSRWLCFSYFESLRDVISSYHALSSYNNFSFQCGQFVVDTAMGVMSWPRSGSRLEWRSPCLYLIRNSCQ